MSAAQGSTDRHEQAVQRLDGNPHAKAWVDRLVRSHYRYNDPSSVRCYLGHSTARGPWLELLLQSSDGETVLKLLHLTGQLDITKGDPRVRDGVQAIHLLARFLGRVNGRVVLEHGEAVGRCSRHPVFTEPYHTFDDRILPWDRGKGPPPLGKHLAPWIARHAAAVRALGPVATSVCSLSAGREDRHELYRCEFRAPTGARHVIEFRTSPRRRLSSTPIEVSSIFEALHILSHLLRELRLMTRLVDE